MDEPQIDPELFVQIASSIQFTRYICVVTIALLVYEWLICFGDEYHYIHKARWTSVKLAYYICRFYALAVVPTYAWSVIGHHSIPVCAKVERPLLLLMAILPMFSQGVFIIRTYAFCGRNKFLGAFLLASWMLLFAVYIWIMITKYTFGPFLHSLFGETACIVEEADQAHTGLRFSSITVFSLATFLFDSLLTAMVFIRCIRSRTMWGRLGKTFVTQGVLAYLMLSGIDLAVAIVYLLPDQAHDGVAILRNPASCIIACRLILMFRRRADPAASTVVQNDSQFLRFAAGRMAAELDHSDAKSDHKQPIEDWD